MNILKLNMLETRFFAQYPKGFQEEELIKIGKKHNISRNVDNIHNVCSKEHLNIGIGIVEDIVKVVTRSSIVSVFEKVKFKNLVLEFDDIEKRMLIDAIYENIHGDEEVGFQMMVDLLSPYKLAKWPILTIFRAYYYPNNDIFIKPTTVKKIISFLEIDNMKYTSKANYQFYNEYRKMFNSLKGYTNELLYPSNPAFSGFLMMTIFE